MKQIRFILFSFMVLSVSLYVGCAGEDTTTNTTNELTNSSCTTTCHSATSAVQSAIAGYEASGHFFGPRTYTEKAYQQSSGHWYVFHGSNAPYCNDATRVSSSQPTYPAVKNDYGTTGNSNLDLAMGEEHCNECHTHEGFVQKQSHNHGLVSAPSQIGCFTCHNPHETGDLTLRTSGAVTLIQNDASDTGTTYNYGKGNLCVACHKARTTYYTYTSSSYAKIYKIVADTNGSTIENIDSVIDHTGASIPVDTFLGNLTKEKAEVTTIAFTDDSANSNAGYKGKYMDVYSGTTRYRVWFDVNSTGIQPLADGGTLVEVNVGTSDTAETIAGNVQTALNISAAGVFTYSTPAAGSRQITTVAKVSSTDTTKSTGFTLVAITRNTNGADGTKLYATEVGANRWVSNYNTTSDTITLNTAAASNATDVTMYVGLRSFSGSSGAHHGPQADFLMSRAAYLSTTAPSVSNHAVQNADSCVDCHHYMPISEGRISGNLQFGGHGFYLRSDVHGSLKDYTRYCYEASGCHGATNAAWFTSSSDFLSSNMIPEVLYDYDGDGYTGNILEEIRGMRNTLIGYFGTGSKFWKTDGSGMGASGEGLITSTDGTSDPDFSDTTDSMRYEWDYNWVFGGSKVVVTIDQMKAFWNLKYFVEDKSQGVHNPLFAAQMLYDAIKILNDNEGAALPLGSVRPQ